MTVNSLRFLLTVGLVASFCFAFGQADLSVNVRVENTTPEEDELVYAVVSLKNEGDGSRVGMQVELKLSSALFFVNASNGSDFNPNTLIWKVPVLLKGASDSIRIGVQPNYGGIHTLSAELIAADKIDWDSRPNNHNPLEDDQDEACLSVPIQLDCGQELVLNAPKGYQDYTWYRDGELLAYATSDTLHPSGSGAYTFRVNGGGGCSSGNCCPILVDRAQCQHDLALTIDAAPLQPGQPYQDIQIKLFNQGSGAVSRVSVYVTISRMMRLKPGTTNWLLNGSQMKTDWRGLLNPGDSTAINFQIQSISGAAASEYEMFAEIFAFYAGDQALQDADSSPDLDPKNDLLVEGAYTLSPNVDEDDSDVTNLTDCPSILISGNEPVCPGQPLALTASQGLKPVTYLWTGNATISCPTCAETTIEVVEATEITLTTKTVDGCEQVQRITVQTKDCIEDVQLVVSPYGPTSQCWTLQPGTEMVWCVDNLNTGINAYQSNNLSETCASFTTTGEWGGIQQQCVDLCLGQDCERVNFTLVALPKRDKVDGIPGQQVCINDLLQVDANPVNVTVSQAVNGVSLVSNGGECYTINEPATSYPDVLFQIIHRYQLAGISVYDTTDVHVPGKQVCDFDVFALDKQTIQADPISATTAAGTVLCVDGDFPSLAAVNFSLNGQNLVLANTGCDPYTAAQFSLKALPQGYLDNGWRILRYFKGSTNVINNFYAATMEAMLAKIESVDPGSVATFNSATQTIEISNYSVTPGALQIAHLQTGGRVNERPVIVDGFKGTTLQIPAGLAIGSYALIAQSPDGCRDVITIQVEKSSQITFVRDTIFVEVEVGEPLAVNGLEDRIAASNSWELIDQDCFVYFPDQVKALEYHTFTKTTSTQQIETTYAVSVIEKSCTPLVVSSRLVKSSSKCSAEYFNLGLTMPDISIQSSTGTVISASLATGTRPGASYDLNAIPFRGLTSQFEVTQWSGFPAAVGLRGNLMEIFLQLRKAGQDARIDWTANKIYVAGNNRGSFTLKNLENPSQVLSISPVETSLATYGYFLARPGQNIIRLNSPYCSGQLTARVDCRVIVVSGGIFGLQTGEPAELTISNEALTVDYNQWSIEEAPATVTATLNSEGNGILVSSDKVTTDELVIKACNSDGDCKLVKVQLEVTRQAVCDFDIWRPEEVRVSANPATGIAHVTLPSSFERDQTKLFVNSKEKRGGFVLRKVVTEQQYAIDQKSEGAVVRLATPFGKTADVSGNLVEAFTEIFSDTGVDEGTSGVVTVNAEYGTGKVFTEDMNGIWQPMQPRSQKEEDRYTIDLEVGVYELVLHDKAGKCTDQLQVEVVPTKVNYVQERLDLEVGKDVAWCLPTADAGKTVLQVSNVCENMSGERAAVVQDQHCFNIEGFEPGTEELCIRRTYLDGSIDSVTVQLVIQAIPVLTTRDDHDTLEIGTYKIIEVLANDDLSAEPKMLSLISEPFFGRAQVIGNSAIEYLHNGTDCSVDVFTYEVCQGDECESATVQLDIVCEDLLVFNGLSPNGDGVNDELTIMGLSRYPKHVISIFNRDGALLISLRDYANDWRGDVAGQPLPEGTYFYVIDLGDGTKASGYLQINR